MINIFYHLLMLTITIIVIDNFNCWQWKNWQSILPLNDFQMEHQQNTFANLFLLWNRILHLNFPSISFISSKFQFQFIYTNICIKLNAALAWKSLIFQSRKGDAKKCWIKWDNFKRESSFCHPEQYSKTFDCPYSK